MKPWTVLKVISICDRLSMWLRCYSGYLLKKYPSVYEQIYFHDYQKCKAEMERAEILRKQVELARREFMRRNPASDGNRVVK